MKRHRSIERWGFVLPCFVIAAAWPCAGLAAPPAEGGFEFDEGDDDESADEGFSFDEGEGEGEGQDEGQDEGEGEEFIMAPVAETPPSGEAPPTGEPPTTDDLGDLDAELDDLEAELDAELGGPDGELSEDSAFTFEDISEDQEALDLELKSGEVQAEGVFGTVSGVIANAKGEPLAAVYIRAKDSKYVARTGIDGKFELRVPPGDYTLLVELNLYVSKEITGVSVAEGASVSQDVELVPMAGVMETYEVKDELNLEAEGALQEARKQKTSVNDGIDATEISKSGGGKASSVAVRIVGATVVDGRYLFVRGLGHRYGNTLLDGARVPSPEPEIRTVPLDMFPSGALSAIDIQKTFTPDVPGDFTGGSTQFVTRDAPSEPKLEIGVDVGANTNTTFRPMVVDAGYAGWDAFALGNIPRGVPSLYPTNEAVGRGAFDSNFEQRWTDEEIEAQGKALDTRTKLRRVMAPANFGVKLMTGNSWTLSDNGGRIGVLFAGGYANKHQTNREIVRQYGLDDDVPSLDPPKVDLRSLKTDYAVNYNGLLKLQLAANSNNRFDLTGLYTREAHDETRDMYGTAFGVAGIDQLNYTRQRYTMRSVAFTQLRGHHKIPRAANLEVDYFGSFSQARNDDPSLREMVYRYNPGGDYYKIDTSQGPTGNQIFLGLVDNNENGALDLTLPFRQWKGLDSKVKAGAWIDAKQRDFTARRYNFTYAGGLVDAVPEGRDNPINDDTIGGGVGADLGGTKPFALVDQLRKQDSYRATSRNLAGYLMLDLPFVSWFKVTGGLRLESNIIAVDPYDLYNPDEPADIGNARLVELDWLPAAALIFSPKLPDKAGDMNIRLGGTKTLARPEFRELAPFQFRDYVGGFSKQGYTELRSTKIWNADLRLEWFPRKAEVVAVSAFFKQFTDPIEEVIAATDNPSASWANAAGALNGGFELEFRKALDFLAPKDNAGARAILRDFSVGANFAYIYSRVRLGPPCHRPGETPQFDDSVELEDCRSEYQVSTSSVRPLQGQSPWIVNAYLDYDNDELGTNVRVMYNAFGPFISQVQGLGLPDMYQQPMHMLDFVASQRLLSYKVNDWGDLRNQLLLTVEIENLLNTVDERNIGPVTYRTRDGVDFKIGLTWKY